MFTKEDLELFEKKGISEQKVSQQLESFVTGFPFLPIVKAAGLEQGVLRINDKESEILQQKWDEYLQGDSSILKFVPASGAASRMFKDIFEFAGGDNPYPTKKAELQFFEGIKQFAFYEALNAKCKERTSKEIDTLVLEGQYQTIASLLLKEEGLNYGSLPKGLLLFHSYDSEIRTAMEEHLVEGALYAKNKKNEIHLHFTVSSEHRVLFEKKLNEVIQSYSQNYNSKYIVSFSEQKPSTDTVAADENNEAFREENGKIVFRPGGHGALIENLNDLDSDIVFIKNIDNVVPDKFKQITVEYKKIIAGILIETQSILFNYLEQLDNINLSEDKLAEMMEFNNRQLWNIYPNIDSASREAKIEFLKTKFNRPTRVCGMVKNTGEPGGGPFLTINKDGSTSPQILESSQIDLSNPAEKEKMMNSSHFNPVDLVCGIKDFQGNKFDLTKFVDTNTGFISSKSKNGKELKALELPGLWNGAMSDWNTIFVEVPIETFNPVKTVNDLLRTEHQ